MIIVSQDKKSIVNFNNVLKIDCINDEIIVFYKSEEVPGVDGTESIGFYETEERAKEVLQEIIKKVNSPKYFLKPKIKTEQRTIESAKKYFEDINGINLIIDDNNFEIKPVNNNNTETIIYEMPER